MTRARCAVVIASGAVDPQGLDRYLDQMAATIGRFGGQLHVVGAVTVLEGESAPSVAAVVEFPDAVAAASWFDSTEHAAVRQERPESAATSVLLVEPAPPPPST